MTSSRKKYLRGEIDMLKSLYNTWFRDKANDCSRTVLQSSRTAFVGELDFVIKRITDVFSSNQHEIHTNVNCSVLLP